MTVSSRGVLALVWLETGPQGSYANERGMSQPMSVHVSPVPDLQPRMQVCAKLVCSRPHTPLATVEWRGTVERVRIVFFVDEAD